LAHFHLIRRYDLLSTTTFAWRRPPVVPIGAFCEVLPTTAIAVGTPGVGTTENLRTCHTATSRRPTAMPHRRQRGEAKSCNGGACYDRVEDRQRRPAGPPIWRRQPARRGAGERPRAACVRLHDRGGRCLSTSSGRS